MYKKEYYKHNLPHFQQPGQAYFVTWSLKDAVPKHKLKHITTQIEIVRSQLGSGVVDSYPRLKKLLIGIHDTQTEKLKNEYNLLRKRYLKNYNELLDAQQKTQIDLSKSENTKVLVEAFNFWEGIKLKNHAFCVMPNHVHWVFEVFEKDEEGKPVYLQDILYSVKRFTANQLNKLEKRKGVLWQKESFDTTIRDEKHLYYAVEYTLNNPVNARLVKDWKDWDGCWSAG